MRIVAASYLLPVSSPPVAGGAMVIDKGRIIALGKLSDIRASYPSPVEEFPGCVLMPGFVNAHSHLELTHFPSWKIRKGLDYSPRTYVDWVIQIIKINRALTRQERELSLHEGLRISLESGTTAIGDIAADATCLPLYGACAITGRLNLEAIGQEPMRCSSLLARLKEELGHFAGSKMLPGLSPHAPHTLSERFMKDVVGLAAANSVPVTIHLAESREEMDFLYDSSGKIAELLYPHVGWQDFIPAPRKMTSVEYLERLGVLHGAPTLIHSVHVTVSDVEILKKRGCKVVLCPRSNDKLDVGRAPAQLFRKSGLPLALGTDSLASNDSLSMQDEMRFLWKSFPGVFTAAEILHMATLGGAVALDLAHETGSLAEGKRADFLVMGLDRISAPDDLPREILEEGRLIEVAPGGEYLTSAAY